MTAHSKSFEQRYRELRETGKTAKQALEIIIAERKLSPGEIPNGKHKAKPKERKNAGRKTGKRSGRR